MSNSLIQDAPSASTLPEWLSDSRREAASRFESLPMPSRRDEYWRFSNLKTLDPQDFAAALPVDQALAETLIGQSTGVPDAAASLVFANDHLASVGTSTHGLGRGVIFLPLEEAFQTHSELVHRYFMRSESTLGSSKFHALHRASVKTGSFLYVPKGVQITAPLQSFHWLAGSGQAIFPHTLIVAEEGSSLTFVDWFKSVGDARNMVCGINDLHVGQGANVVYVSVQNLGKQTVSIHSNATSVAGGGDATHLGLHLGGAFSRSESVSRLTGKNARCQMLAATVADQNQEFDQRTLQDHASPDTQSDLLYKNALYDHARTIVSGLIRVEPHAHRTDAFQKVRNLVLSPDAEANSLPGLEILADDVRCSHGATTGQIDAEELFYMQARGINSRDAYRLITYGFLNEVLERLQNDSLRKTLQDALTQRLQGH